MAPVLLNIRIWGRGSERWQGTGVTCVAALEESVLPGPLLSGPERLYGLAFLQADGGGLGTGRPG
mgnify:CR=1 FL=1